MLQPLPFRTKGGSDQTMFSNKPFQPSEARARAEENSRTTEAPVTQEAPVTEETLAGIAGGAAAWSNYLTSDGRCKKCQRQVTGPSSGWGGYQHDQTAVVLQHLAQCWGVIPW